MSVEESPLQVLLFCNRPSGSSDASTISEHIDAFAQYSKHKITVWSSLKGLPTSEILKRFDCLIVHYSISFLSERYISRETLERIRSFKGLKIVFIQDEYRRVDFICMNLKYAGIHVLFSCAPIEVARKMYAALSPGVEIHSTLTGYVSDACSSPAFKPYRDRGIDVGYRARKLPFFLGRKGQEKFLIGEKFRILTKGMGLKVDISSRESDRLYGNDWIEFLGDCKATLGTDSGSSLIDFTGILEYRLHLYQAFKPWAKFENLPPDLLEQDGVLEIQVISPRCFEAAKLGCAMIMFEGQYSGILKPDRHYVQLARDFSNLNEVIDKLKETENMQAMIDRCYEDLIVSGKYSYRCFVEGFDEVLYASWNQVKGPLFEGSLNLPENIPVLQNEAISATPVDRFRSYLGELFKVIPDWLRFLLVVTFLKGKYFSHLCSKNTQFLNK